ncbi:MAG: SRPBCC family protein [Candidatus Omnitrophica bacterium]|nr:SRPBCC family protein [Candidatus Omnitrophota bacterium]
MQTKSQTVPYLISIKLSKVLPDQKSRVFKLITEVEHFTHYMPNVKRCVVLEKTGNYTITQWNIELDQIPITWKEKVRVDPAGSSIYFNAIDGDLAKFDGTWTLKDHPQGTELCIEAEVDIGIPVVGQLVAPVLEEKIKKNFIMMLEGLNNKLVSDHYRSFLKGTNNKIGGFALIGHPYNLNNLIRYLKFCEPTFKPPSQEFLNKIYELVPSFVMCGIEKFRSAAGVDSRGLFIQSTFVPDMVSVDEKMVFQKVVEACRMAESHQIGIATLGGFTSIVGERFGDELAKMTHIPLTTGNTYTVSLALDGVRKACELMGIELTRATVCIIGGTGDIGSGCARILAKEVKGLVLTGRDAARLEAAVDSLKRIRRSEVSGTTDNAAAVRTADIVIAAASVTNSILKEEWFKSGTIICDLAYPKNLCYTVKNRNDLLIFSGGLAEIPQEIDFEFEIGLPSTHTLYGCFAEAILLDLERRYENFSYGRGKITPEKVSEIKKIAERHGFRVAPFYWGNRLLSAEEITGIKHSCQRKTAA